MISGLICMPYSEMGKHRDSMVGSMPTLTPPQSTLEAVKISDSRINLISRCTVVCLVLESLLAWPHRDLPFGLPAASSISGVVIAILKYDEERVWIRSYCIHNVFYQLCAIGNL